MALRLYTNFVLMGTPFCLARCSIKIFNRNLNSHTFTISKDCRPCVQSIVECYQNRYSFLHFEQPNKHKNTLVERKEDNNDVYRVVLTARPDEFHKLPPKCTACGAILQTKHETQTGFINEMKFLDSLKKGIIDKLVCFNCYRLRYHNSPVTCRVDSSDAMNQLRHLRQRKALILYIVDLFDIEGTMLHNILQLVGKNKRMLIVGNKIDRLPQDYKKPAEQLEAIKDVLKHISFQNGLENCNFKDICLVSAKTGYGLKTLVTKINKHREDYMDVYLVGCTNTGKSTLYNLLINMLNVHKSGDLPAQAIEHHIPGTTSSLIRENISRYKLEKMSRRLEQGPWEVEETFNFDEELLDLLNVDKDGAKYKTLGIAADKKHNGKNKLLEQSKMMEARPLEFVDKNFSHNHEEKGCFIYDTPGILNNTQIVQYLTPSEINYLSPTRWVVPRTYLLKPGNCLFVGGLARLDYLSITRAPLKNKENDTEDNSSSEELLASGQGIYVTTMVSPNVPIHITITETADEKFEKLFSSNFLELPKGSPERFKEYPKLRKCEYTVVGKSRNTNACDLVIHGIGWLSIAAVWESRVCLALHTPNGEGQGLRLNPLLPYTVQKKLGRGLPYHGHLNRYMYGHTRKRSPQFIRVFQQQNDAVYSWQLKIKQKMKQERFQKKENERLHRIEHGIVLGRRKSLKDKEEKMRLMDEQNYAKLIEEAK